MARNVTLNGQSYSTPQVGEAYGASFTNYLYQLASDVMTKDGGTRTLLAELDVGANYGLKIPYLKSRATISTTGILRLGNTESVSWRNAANSADLALSVDSSNILTFNGNPITTLALGAANTVLRMNSGGTATEYGLLSNANIDASAAIAYSKLASMATGSILLGNGGTPTATALSGDITVGATGVTAISSGVIVNDDINASAAIAHSKMAANTASRALVSDASGFTTSSSVTATELGYVSGVTSAIQTQLNAKLDDVGTATDNALVRFDTNGQALQNSVITVDDTGIMSGLVSLTDTLGVDNAKEIRFKELTANGTSYIGIKASNSLSASTTFTLPTADGSANQVLNTNGSGALGWATVIAADANNNISADAFIPGFTTTATAAGTTTLTVSSNETQEFTGVTTQTVTMPTTSIVAGQKFTIINNSTGIVTVQSSGANTIQAMDANTTITLTALVATPTTAAHWDISVGAAATATSNGLVKMNTGATTNTVAEYEDNTSLSANGSFSSGTLRLSRVGKQVAISFNAMGHASLSSVSSSAGLIPVAYRPSVNVSVLYNMGGSAIGVVTIQTDGVVNVQYRDWAGSLVAQTSTGVGTISYTI